MNRSDAANRLERLLRRDLEDAAREAGPPGAEEIDAYVAGRASAAEREVIESWLADDPALQAEVEAVMAMRQAIEGEASATSEAVKSPAQAAPVSARVEAAKRARKPADAQTARDTRTGTRTPSAPQTPVLATAQQMRARPLRSVAMIAVAASLAFVALWVASPGRPPIDSELASGGGAGAPSNPAASGTAAGGATPGDARGGAGTSTAPAPAPASAATLTLRDAGGEVSLLANGEIRGLEGLDASNRSAVARALASGRLELTDQIDALAASGSVLRGSRDAAPAALRVVKPLATAVRTARPTFEWTTIPGATAYRVRVADASLNEIAESPLLAATATTWTPDAALPTGRVLMWQVEAQTPQGAIVAPAPPASEARLLVLRTADAQSLASALDSAKGSDLAAAVTLARFGVLDEADAALARLIAANPNADAVARLRRQLSDRRFPR